MTPALLREAATMSEPVNWDEAFEEAASEARKSNAAKIINPRHAEQLTDEAAKAAAGITAETTPEADDDA